MADLASLRISVDSRGVVRATGDLSELNKVAGRTTSSVQGVERAASSLGKVLASLGISLGVAELVRMADTYNRLSGQIALVTHSAQQLAETEQNLFDLAQRTRVGYEGTVSLYTRLARSTEALGVSQASVLRVTETINKALIISGTDAQQASGSLMQLGQAFASGALRGDELNSVMEGMPRLAQAIAQGMGITVGELRALGAEGELTAEAVYNALIKMGGAIDSEFSQMPVTVSQSMTMLNNAFMQFISEIDRATGITRSLSQGIVWLANNLGLAAAALSVLAVRLAAVRAQMALSAITGYLGQIIALERALGATSASAALFSAAMKGAQRSFMQLTATMMVNPFVAITTAIAAVIALLYAYRDENIKVGENTVTIGNIMAGVWDYILRGLEFVQKVFSEGWAEALGSIAGPLRWVGEQFDALGNYIYNKINKWIGAFAGLAAAISAFFKGDDVSDAFSRAFNADYIGIVGDAIGGLAIHLNDVGASTRRVTAGSQETAAALRAVAQEEEKAARDRDNKERQTENFIAALREEIATIGMNEFQLRQHAIAQALNAAATREQREEIILLNQARENALRIQAEEAAAEERRKLLEQNTQDVRDAIAAQEAYNAMIGMSGAKLRIAQIEEERRIRALELTRDGLQELIPIWNEYYDLQVEAANQETILDKEREKAEELRKQLQGVLATLDDILGTNGAIGNLFNRLEDDFPDFFKKMQKGFEGIAKSFGLDLGKAMDGFMMGAEMGKMFAGLSKAVGLPSSKTGGQIGGAIGGVFGPVGAAIGSVVGSLGVGLAKGVKKASATIEVLASDQVQQTVKGNKALQDAATGMANSLIDGLKKVADALGGSLLEGVKISIGQRGNTFRVDPLGLGRTKGMEKFKTEEEAIAYAMKLALEKGVIKGISESAQRLLAAGNDLQDAIEKAVLFEGVFDRLKEKLDPVGYSLEKLDKEFAKLRVIFDEAGASTAEYASLQQLYELQRAEIVKKAAETNSLALVNEALFAAGLQKLADGLETAVMQSEQLVTRFGGINELQTALSSFAESFLTEAERMAPVIQSVRMEMDRLGYAGVTTKEQFKALVLGLDLSTMAGQEMLSALMAIAPNFAKATEYLGNLNNTTEEIADNSDLAASRRALEIEIMELQGLAEEALTAKRMDALNAMDASLRPLQQMVYVLQDQAAAAERAAAVTAEVVSLQRQLLEAQGDTAALREQDLSKLQSEEARQIQQQIWAIEDARAAQEALNRARQESVSFDNSADEAAALAQQIAQERAGLERQLLELTGQTAKIRQMELDALHPSNRALQQRIWALQDEAEASKKLQDQIEQARGQLTEAYNREADALRDVIGRFRDFGNGLRTFRNNLSLEQEGTGDRYRRTLMEFNRVSSAAAIGDETALGQLQDVSLAFLDASKSQARSQLDYIRDLARVTIAVDEAIAATDGAIDYAELQLEALDKSVAGLMEVNQSVLTVADAIRTLTDLMAQATGVSVPAFATGGMHSGGIALVGEQGPELVNMGPSRIWNANDTRAIMQSEPDGDLRREMRETKEYIRELVRINIKQERSLREIELQGETDTTSANQDWGMLP